MVRAVVAMKFCGSGLRRRSKVTSAAKAVPASSMETSAPVEVLVIVSLSCR
jgi:hypothetical protein